MYKIKGFFATAAIVVAAMFAGCETEGKIDPNNPPVMQLDTYELNITGGGGDIPLYYTVKNPVKGADIEVITAVDWISLKEITSSTIVLRIQPSDVYEERFASVTIKYPGMENPLRVSVLQDKQLLNKFQFEISNKTYNSCTVSYIPTDKNMPYMANIIDAEYFKQSGTDDPYIFIEAEMEYYLSLADRNQMTLEELMTRVSPQLIYTGTAERSFVDMKHGSTYVIYSYGIVFQGNEYTLTTPMHHTLIELPMPEMYDATFNVSTQKSGTVATISISPENWSGHYHVQIAPEDSLYYIEPEIGPSDSILRNIASAFYDKARNAIMNGSSIEQFLRNSCYQGDKQLNISLETNKRYMVIVFAVESENGAIPVMRSIPTFKYI